MFEIELGEQGEGMSSRDAPVKVFLADDSALIRAHVAAMLEAHAMTIVGQAETPQACIDGILATGPDVVVLDIRLAGGQGLEVLRAIHPVHPDIAFIVFSNNSESAYRKRYLGAGAVSFLDKSADFDRLPHAVGAAGELSH